MAKITPLAVMLFLAVGAGGATAQNGAANAAPAKRVLCVKGGERAVIGGRIRCLRIGMRCDTRFNTTKTSYRRYGFLCSSWYTRAPTTLFRITQPGAAPATCDGIGVAPSSAPPGSENAWVGASPLWIGPYLDWQSTGERGVWHYRYTTGLRDQTGWGVKFLWQLLKSAGPAQISLTDRATGKLLHVILAGSYVERSTAPILDPTRPGHPDPFDQHPTASEWGSTVLFPRAGCYRLDAQWLKGSTTIVFSFGR